MPPLPLAVAAVAASLVGALPATPSAATAELTSCSSTHWVGSWSASPTDATSDLPSVEQTFRSQVVPHRGGATARLRLSNRFGTAPVTFGAVSLGVAARAPAIEPGTLRTLRFHGWPSVTVPAGREVLSDPVRLRFSAFQTLLASAYVRGTGGPATQHVLAGQTSWRTPQGGGNAAGSTSGRPFTIATPTPGSPVAAPQSVTYVSGLDVRASRRVGAVVAFGDSITDGFQGDLSPVTPAPDQIDRNTRYPDWLAHRVLAAGAPLSVTNAGISGNQLLADAKLPIFGPAGLRRLGSDAFGVPGVTTVLMLEGINDIGQSSATRDQLVSGYRAAITRAHARGLRIVLGTLTPDEGTLQPGYGSTGEATRQAVNSWIRSQGLSDGIVDFDKAVRDPAHPARLLAAYDGSDHLHLTAAGYRAMARAVPLGLLARPRCS